jgi:hypothetical protein
MIKLREIEGLSYNKNKQRSSIETSMIILNYRNYSA